MALESQTTARGLRVWLARGFALAFVASVFAPCMVMAQSHALEPRAGRVSLGGEAGYFTRGEATARLHVTTLRVFGEYAFDARWSLAADFGVVAITSSPQRGDAERALRPGNPTVLGFLRGALGAFDYKLGFGGAAPLAVIEREGAGRLHHTAYNWVQAMTGLRDLWRWAPSRGAVVGLARAGTWLAADLRVEGEVAPALLIPARDAFAYGDPLELFVPLAGTAAYRVGPWTPGLRLQAVLMTSGTDPLQLSFEPWVRLAFGGGFVELRYNRSVGEPLSGERGPGSWGLHLIGGGTL
jgi:hypothetical protein